MVRRKALSNKSSDDSLNIAGGKPISRRAAISKLTAVSAGLGVAVVVAGVGGYLAGSQAAPARTVERTVTAPAAERTVTVEKTIEKTVTITGPATKPTITWPPWKPEPVKPTVPLVWVHWGYRPDIITENIEIFNQQNNENLTQEQVTGPDYQGLVETKFLAGEKFDMVYGNAFMAFRWVELGFTNTAEELPYIEWVKADMFDSVKRAYSDKQGRLAGLTYFVSATPALIANDVLLEKAGMAGELPTTHAELYDMLRKIKQRAPAGMIKPYVPHWFNAFWGTVWSLLAEVAGRAKDPELTKSMFGKDFAATFDAAPGDTVYETVSDWRKLVDEDLVETAVISASSDTVGTEAFWTGNYAFGRLNGLYGYWNTMDPAKSRIAGKATLVPVTKEAWGLIDTGLYCWPKNNHDYDRSARLILWFGYKDNNGKHTAAFKWAAEEFLHTAYPAVLSDPDVLKAWEARLGPKTKETSERSEKWLATMATPWIWRSPLYGEWMVKAPDYMAKCLAREISPKDAVSNMRKLADELWKKYHG
jgi:ABC-type glycerol-3-phosphate transport system substrate-binding protein